MHGLVPSLGLSWSEGCVRNSPNLELPTLRNSSTSLKTSQRRSLCIEGVRLFNSLPPKVKAWNGSAEAFKHKLDEYLAGIPDQPQVDGLEPEAKEWEGVPSNSLVDWRRHLDLREN